MIGILKDKYGINRNVDKDFGCYIQVIELLEEYSDEICTTENGMYTIQHYILFHQITMLW